MNLTLGRVLYGLLGAFLGFCLACIPVRWFGWTFDYRIIIIVCTVSFVIFLFWGFQMIKLLAKIFSYVWGHQFKNK